jgi:predicted RNA-binding protein with PUA-like domain
MNYWIFKTEPDVLSIEKLSKLPQQTSPWDGVRNYQARNFMMKEMKIGDQVFIYHSSCETIGIAGLAKVVKESYPDFTQFDPKSDYFDPKSTLDNPRWYMVDVKWVKSFKNIISLDKLKNTKGLSELIILKRGNRLSITPITSHEFETILKLQS